MSWRNDPYATQPEKPFPSREVHWWRLCPVFGQIWSAGQVCGGLFWTHLFTLSHFFSIWWLQSWIHLMGMYYCHCTYSCLFCLIALMARPVNMSWRAVAFPLDHLRTAWAPATVWWTHSSCAIRFLCSHPGWLTSSSLPYTVWIQSGLGVSWSSIRVWTRCWTLPGLL